MTLPAWPSTVPFLCDLRSLSRTGPRGNTVAFFPDAGPFKVRRVTTAGYVPFSGQTPVITSAQRTTFLNFWDYTIQSGVLSFVATHPFTGELTVFRSDGTEYTDTCVAPGKFKIGLTLYEVPS